MARDLESVRREVEQTRPTRVDLSWLGLDAVPEWLRDQVQIESLSLGNNGLSVLPDWLGGMTNLVGCADQPDHPEPEQQRVDGAA